MASVAENNEYKLQCIVEDRECLEKVRIVYVSANVTSVSKKRSFNRTKSFEGTLFETRAHLFCNKCRIMKRDTLLTGKVSSRITNAVCSPREMRR